MRTPLAHSARKNYPSQTYEAHVRGVCERAGKYAAEAECYSVKANGILSTIVRDSARLHDLGKLEERNQSVLCEQSRRRRHLPEDHTDAGSAALQKMGNGLCRNAGILPSPGFPRSVDGICSKRMLHIPKWECRGARRDGCCAACIASAA